MSSHPTLPPGIDPTPWKRDRRWDAVVSSSCYPLPSETMLVRMSYARFCVDRLGAYSREAGSGGLAMHPGYARCLVVGDWMDTTTLWKLHEKQGSNASSTKGSEYFSSVLVFLTVCLWFRSYSAPMDDSCALTHGIITHTDPFSGQ